MKKETKNLSHLGESTAKTHASPADIPNIVRKASRAERLRANLKRRKQVTAHKMRPAKSGR